MPAGRSWTSGAWRRRSTPRRRASRVAAGAGRATRRSTTRCVRRPTRSRRLPAPATTSDARSVVRRPQHASRHARDEAARRAPGPRPPARGAVAWPPGPRRDLVLPPRAGDAAGPPARRPGGAGARTGTGRATPPRGLRGHRRRAPADLRGRPAPGGHGVRPVPAEPARRARGRPGRHGGERDRRAGAGERRGRRRAVARLGGDPRPAAVRDGAGRRPYPAAASVPEAVRDRGRGGRVDPAERLARRDAGRAARDRGRRARDAHGRVIALRPPRGASLPPDRIRLLALVRHELAIAFRAAQLRDTLAGEQALLRGDPRRRERRDRRRGRRPPRRAGQPRGSSLLGDRSDDPPATAASSSAVP